MTATKANRVAITVDGDVVGEYADAIERVVKQATGRGSPRESISPTWLPKSEPPHPSAPRQIQPPRNAGFQPGFQPAMPTSLSACPGTKRKNANSPPHKTVA